MTTEALDLYETDQIRINQAVMEMQQGRSNAHGEVTLAVSPAVSTIVEDPTCTTATTVVLSPMTANAANLQRTSDIYILPGDQFFEIFHGATVNADCTYRYSIQG